MALSGLAIAGIVLIIIGIIMAIIGIVILVVNNNSTSIPWFVWLLIVGGILLGIIGGIMLAVALSEPEYPPCYKPNPCAPAPVPVITPVTPTCPLAAAPVAIRSVATAPVVRAPVVPPVYSERVERIGTETFDPDPQSTVEDRPGVAVRRNVIGPYGPQGQETVVSGVHKLPGERVTRTYDIPEHEVTSNYSGATTYPVAANYPVTTYPTANLY